MKKQFKTLYKLDVIFVQQNGLHIEFKLGWYEKIKDANRVMRMVRNHNKGNDSYKEIRFQISEVENPDYGKILVDQHPLIF